MRPLERQVKYHNKQGNQDYAQECELVSQGHVVNASLKIGNAELALLQLPAHGNRSTQVGDDTTWLLIMEKGVNFFGQPLTDALHFRQIIHTGLANFR